MATQDALWKSIIEDLFEEMIYFFYPENAGEIDFTTVEFLDQELQELSPESASGIKYADKLVKFRLKVGEERWMLIHVEVQGYKDENFAQRMFTYFYRIWDRYGIPVEALAIFSDPDVNFHPKEYSYKAFRTYMNYGFHSYKIMEQSQEELSQSNNPFAMVILLVREFLQQRRWKDPALLELKRKLFRILLEKGLSKSRIESLLIFLIHYVNFKQEEPKKLFENEIHAELNRQASMGIKELIKEINENKLREAKAEGIAQGKAEGITAGKLEGKLEGKAEGRLEGENQKVIELTYKLLQKGMAPEEIHQLLDFPMGLILKVKKVFDKGTSLQALLNQVDKDLWESKN